MMLIKYTYIIGSKHSGLYKIGHTKDVQRRLRQIQTGCPYKLEIICSWSSTCADIFENKLKEWCAEYHTLGEWYVFGDDEIAKLREWAHSNDVPDYLYPLRLVKSVDEDVWRKHLDDTWGNTV